MSSEEKKSRSAVDEIYHISKAIEMLSNKISLIDNNIKILNNKIAKLSKKIDLNTVTPSRHIPPPPKAPSVTIPKMIDARSDELVIGDIKVFGYIYNKNQAPIKNVKITIYNDKGQIVKEKATDDKGYWNCYLPSGKYGVELNHSFKNKKFKPINRTIILKPTIKEYEVI